MIIKAFLHGGTLNLKRLLILFLLAAPLRAQQGYKFNVNTYGGAVCDGVRDDTAAVQKTIDAAAAVVQANGSPGPIYFPPSMHPCKVDTITFPGVSRGWLYSLFDNGLLANRIVVGSYNAFQGRSANFQTGALFPFGPTVPWVQWQHPTNQSAFVDLNGASFVNFKGIGIDVGYSPLPAVHIHNWCVNIKFEESGVGGRFLVGPSGFNLRIIDSVMTTPGGTGVALDINGFGYVTVRGSYLKSVAITGHPGVSLMDGFRFEDLLSENLNKQPWLTLNGMNGQISNIILDSVRIADSVGSCYLVKNLHTGASITIRNSGINDGISLVDPASVPNGLQGIIESMGARATFEKAKAAFQWGQFTSGNGPTIYYGSPTFLKYIGAPMQVNP